MPRPRTASTAVANAEGRPAHSKTAWAPCPPAEFWRTYSGMSVVFGETTWLAPASRARDARKEDISDTMMVDTPLATRA